MKYAPSDYTIVVPLRDKTQDLGICKIISGSQVPEFFDKGEAEITYITVRFGRIFLALRTKRTITVTATRIILRYLCIRTGIV